MKPFVLRTEQDGSGFLFNRSTGVADRKTIDEMPSLRERSDIDAVRMKRKFPSCARSAPFCVWFKLTRRCPIRCTYCPSPQHEDYEPLTLDQVDFIFEDMADCGIFEVRFTGGEPTMHSQFAEIVELAARKGFFISLGTSGCMDDALRQRLHTLCISMYIISLDGPHMANDVVRSHESYEGAIRTIETLRSKGTTTIRVNTVLTKISRDNLSQFVPILLQLGVQGLTLMPLRPAGIEQGVYESLALTPEEYRQAMIEVHELRMKYNFDIAASYDTMSRGRVFNTAPHFAKRCIAGVESACMSPNGDLRACILADGEGYIVGNALKEPFNDIWSDDQRWGNFRGTWQLPSQCIECDLFSQEHCPGYCHIIGTYYGPDNPVPFCPLKE